MIIGVYLPGSKIEIPEFNVVLCNVLSAMPGAAFTYAIGDMNVDMLSLSGSMD